MALRADDVDLGRDRDLVLRSQAGDDGAFEELYRRYFDRLYRFCLRRVGDPHEAEELAQEAFARAYRALPRLGGERRFYPWLSVIAARLCIDEHRRRARSEPASDVDPGVTEGGQERVLQQVDVVLLRHALTRLTPRHQDVLRLREHEGLSYQHIADHLGVNLGTVEALLHRARRALRREFDSVSGTDAVPVAVGSGLFARLARRLQILRAKVAGWDEAWVPVLGHAVAAVVAAAVVMVGSTITTNAAARTTPSGPLALVAAAAAFAGGDGPAAGTVVDRSEEVAVGGAEAGAQAHPAFRPGRDLPAGGVEVRDDPGRAADQPTVVDVLGVTVGADVETAVEETTQAVRRWHDELREEGP